MKSVCKETLHLNPKTLRDNCREGASAAYSEACMSSCVNESPPSPNAQLICELDRIIVRPQKLHYEWCVKGYEQNFKQVQGKALAERARLLAPKEGEEEAKPTAEDVKAMEAAESLKTEKERTAKEEAAKKIADEKAAAAEAKKQADLKTAADLKAVAAAKAKATSEAAKAAEQVEAAVEETKPVLRGTDAADMANDGHATIKQGLSEEETKLEEMAAEMMRKNAIEIAKRELANAQAGQ